MDQVIQICECNSYTYCNKQVKITLEQIQEIQKRGLVIIVDGCQNGPSSTDQFVEQREGYALYMDKE